MNPDTPPATTAHHRTSKVRSAPHPKKPPSSAGRVSWDRIAMRMSSEDVTARSPDASSVFSRGGGGRDAPVRRLMMRDDDDEADARMQYSSLPRGHVRTNSAQLSQPTSTSSKTHRRRLSYSQSLRRPPSTDKLPLDRVRRNADGNVVHTFLHSPSHPHNPSSSAAGSNGTRLRPPKTERPRFVLDHTS